MIDRELTLEFTDGDIRIEKSAMGESYVMGIDGNKIIKGSRRKDGTYRKDIRIKKDYIPQEEKTAYKTRQQLLKEAPTSLFQSSMSVTIPEETDVTTKSRRRRKNKNATEEKTVVKEVEKAQKQIEAMNISSTTKPITLQTEVEAMKRLRNLRKKLKEINDLEKKSSNGMELSKEQLQKLDRKEAITTEIEELSPFEVAS